MWRRFCEMWLSCVRGARVVRATGAPDTPAAPPDPIQKLAEKAHDLDSVRKTVEDAASVSAGIWLSYIFALLYIGIAAGAVTHKDLLLENPVKLPFLGVELPLVAFFFLAPILFIISHAYTLVYFVMLAAKAGRFKAELRAQLPRRDEDHETREGFRWQLPSNIFVQFLAGPRAIRAGCLGRILQWIAWASLVIGPVLLLLLIQVQFLPYHLSWVTWVQRFAVFVDVGLMWALWPAVLNGRSEIKWPHPWHHRRLALASLVAMGLAFTAATFPGEWLDEYVGKRQWIPPNPITAWLGQKDWTSLHNLLFNGEVDVISRRRKSLFSNTLVLPGFDALEAKTIDDQKKLDWAKHTLILRDRHLENAVFDEADLRKADLTGAYLQGARLDYARLEGVLFEGTQLQGAHLRNAQLQSANLLNSGKRSCRAHRSRRRSSRAHRSKARGCRARRSMARGCRAPRSAKRSSRARRSPTHGSRARRSPTHGSRAHRSTKRGSKARNSPARGCRARRSTTRSSTGPILRARSFRARRSKVRSSEARRSRMYALGEPTLATRIGRTHASSLRATATGRLPRSRNLKSSSPSRFPKAISGARQR